MHAVAVSVMALESMITPARVTNRDDRRRLYYITVSSLDGQSLWSADFFQLSSAQFKVVSVRSEIIIIIYI